MSRKIITETQRAKSHVYWDTKEHSSLSATDIPRYNPSANEQGSNIILFILFNIRRYVYV